MNWYKDIKISMPVYDVYHGTDNAGSIYDQNFSYSYMGQGNDGYGPGFYFTNDLPTAQGYIGKGNDPGVIEAQVTLSNPIEINGTESSDFFDKFPTLDQYQVGNMLHYSLSNLGDDFLSNWGDTGFEDRDVIIERVIDNYADTSLMKAVYDFFGADTNMGFNYIKDEIGNDGIVASFDSGVKIIVAWFTDQINITSKRQ